MGASMNCTVVKRYVILWYDHVRTKKEQIVFLACLLSCLLGDVSIRLVTYEDRPCQTIGTKFKDCSLLFGRIMIAFNTVL